MNVTERVAELRKLMAEKNIDAYIVPSADFHQGEYVGEYFKARAYISGFTGSSGTVVVMKDDAGLWTDGRYFIQAAEQLEGSPVSLYKMGQEGVPTVEEYLLANVPQNGTLGFDGRLMSAGEGRDLAAKLAIKGAKVEYRYDLIDAFWEDRPALSEEKAFLFSEKYCGESFSSKLGRVREEIKKQGATYHVITTLDDIAWLFNIRGGDVKYNPVVLSYAIVTDKEVYLFIDENKLNDELKAEFAKEKVQIKPYNDIYEFVKTVGKDEVVLLDAKKVNYAIFNNIPEEAVKIEDFNPVMFFKSIKNEVELANERNAQIKDGVALTKFMYWLKKNVGTEKITEISADEKLTEFRKQQEGFVDLSFDTIAGYKEHAAMMHYSATPESDYELKPDGMLLVDSGAQFMEGTTDITRTFVLGPISDEIKHDYTSVLRGMVSLSKVKFLYGCRGYNLDILARGPMWQQGIDYQCGTGHGIGFFLNVHENPNGFRWNIRPGVFDTAVIEPGTITTNEPGIYIEGSHGIRIENELLARKAEKNFYGQFLDFEVITFVPIDLDAVVPEIMTQEEKDYLNWYHSEVFNKISPFLDEDEKTWLKEYTRAI
ncbi:MAG: aminopeptidase P family protein [Clostridioides sp.]|jgi:Xaa-Pro aminopeptidase|nr:aminopeptidase P family protein [Clostridioides sp.]